MRNFLLFAALAAALIWGYIAMGKIDVFLAHDRQTGTPSAPKRMLRLGFTDPLLAASLAPLLERLGQHHPEVSVRLYSGTVSSLLARMNAHELDLVFLPEDAPLPEASALQARTVALRRSAVVLPCGHLQVAPLEEDALPQQAVWAASDASPACRDLLAHLDDFAKVSPSLQEDLH